MINIPINETYKTIKQIGNDAINTGSNVISGVRKLIPSQTGKKQRNRMRVAPKFKLYKNLLREQKEIDLTYTNYYLNTTGLFTLCNGIGSGTDAYQRIGRKAQITSIMFKGSLNSPGNFLTDAARIMLLVDRSPDGVVLTTTELFKDPTNPVFSLMNREYKHRFQVLFDTGISSLPITTSCYSVTPLSFHKKTNIITTYFDTGSTISAIAANSIYLLGFGRYSSGADNGTKCLLQGFLRVHFYDM